MHALHFRDLLYSVLIRRVAQGPRKGGEPRLGASAVVFSPHFDDETLGCGGTIIKKVDAGADIRIVFMTDGSASHHQLMSEHQLKEIRTSEGRAAARCLGVRSEHVILLGIPEGRLKENSSEAWSKVCDILRRLNPDEVYIPHCKEPVLWSSDHVETHRIVKQGLRYVGKRTTVIEYPIWYWFHWPWVDIDLRNRFMAKIILRQSIALCCGLSAFIDFNYGVAIDNVLKRKQAALSRHESQMTRLRSAERWTTLHDIGGGSFLRCFFRGVELFLQTHHS